MIVEPDFLTHWKTRMLCGLLEDDAAPLYVIRLWAFCQTRRRWIFDDVSARKLSAICGWNGNPDSFLRAMVESEFLDEEGMELKAHDWENVNAQLVHNWRVGKLGGRPPKKKPEDNPRVSEGLTQEEPKDNPRANPTGTDKIREDKRREEYPLNPPLGEEFVSLRMRLCSIFGHRDERLNDTKVNRAWKKAEPEIDGEAVKLVEDWYAKRSNPPRAFYPCRTALPQLLNNWAHDVGQIRTLNRQIERETRPASRESVLIGGGNDPVESLSAAYLS